MFDSYLEITDNNSKYVTQPNYEKMHEIIKNMQYIKSTKVNNKQIILDLMTEMIKNDFSKKSIFINLKQFNKETVRNCYLELTGATNE